MNNLEPYCKIYVYTEMSKSELICHISNWINGKKLYVRSIISNVIEVDVFTNKDFDKKKLHDEDGFIYYPFYLEIESSEDYTDISIFINEVSLLLQNLWKDCKDAVASCDFEYLLPEKSDLALKDRLT